MGEIDDIIKKVVPYYKKRKASSEYEITYDSSTEQLEPVYFWILDFMEKMFRKTEKLTDNFASSPGSGHFSELQGKASQMQQEASRVLGTVNNILKGIINLIYDLKEFKLRLSHYDAANSKDKITKESGILALKQIWMDKVDLAQRGQGSLNALSSGNLQFVTLRDAFMIVDSPEKVDELDLNDRVKRILKPRIQEFLEWRKRSEQELRKRYEIEKIYLKSQVNALKLNTRWARPYLIAAEKLRQNESISSRPDLVTAFNTIFLQLTLMGIDPINVKDEVMDKKLPRDFVKMEKNLRKYNAVSVIDFEYRGIPSKAGQHYTFGGRVNVKFRGYGLTDKEIELVKLELNKSNMQAALSLVDGMTKDSLEQIQVDIDEILSDKSQEQKNKEEDLNPFSAIFSIFKSETKEEKKKEEDMSDEEKYKKIEKEVKKSENYAEQYIRNYSAAQGGSKAFTVYDVYKKGHGMPGFPFPYSEEFETKLPISAAEKWFLNKKQT
ncbi:hypothetical protein J4218_04170 [Candidatus Pacearchaeota archaeon]|nr:hypothetical protein [Candidatus Pacearchaeota archaeon]